MAKLARVSTMRPIISRVEPPAAAAFMAKSTPRGTSSSYSSSCYGVAVGSSHANVTGLPCPVFRPTWATASGAAHAIDVMKLAYSITDGFCSRASWKPCCNHSPSSCSALVHFTAMLLWYISTARSGHSPVSLGMEQPGRVSNGASRFSQPREHSPKSTRYGGRKDIPARSASPAAVCARRAVEPDGL
ncbi:predicted protein [Chaetomium globosum CBS 148.51]|uniref:Uncharacterized protein n=1 Tax=Chaetomium globosum (strain ATCC 6205 / CBS 148.51 / DSM 1962 / NBRC 6347 / NRRL 1970) TaxID=306901 RepID=Q2GSL6_CHAGB|nr:uncharacterized protein CHGG_09038 [Chaetomium globosum CBS 148.51]EAQ85024.1 predicted protein [Chaetomium globosum CBS 148.51]